MGLTERETRREASTRKLLSKRRQQTAEAEAAISVLSADCRTLQQENVQLRSLGQSLGATSHALLRPPRLRPVPAPAPRREAREARAVECGEGERPSAEPLHSRGALEARVRDVRRQFDEIRQQAADRES